MIGILLFTHGALCHAMKSEAERLTGVRPRVGCLTMIEGETVDRLIERVAAAIDEVDEGQGTVAFIDVAGGTPWNVVGYLKDQQHRPIRRVAGGGIPAVIKALQDRGEHRELDSWADELYQYAIDHVVGDQGSHS